MFTLPRFARLPLFAPDEPPAGGAPEGGETPPAPEGAPPAAEGAPAPDGSPGGSTRDSYTRAEYEAVQREAKNLRDKYVPYRDTFEKYPDEDREAWLWLAQEYQTNPQGAIEAMERLVQASKEGAKPDPEAEKPLTRAEFEAELARREQESTSSRLVEDLHKEAEALGYKRGSLELSDLFFIAQHETEGDLTKAHEKMQERDQKIIDAYLERKRIEAGGSPRVVSSGGPAGEQPTQPKTFAEASAAAKERFRNILNPQ